MKPIEIITGNTSYPAPYTHRVLIICEEKNIPYSLTMIDTENKPAWFQTIAPLGLIPVLRMEEKIIFDSHAICEYIDTLSKPAFLPEDVYLCAQHKSWMMFADELAQEIAQLVKQGNIINADLKRLHFLFDIWNKKIQGDYFFGNQLSLVDIYLLSHVLWFDALEEEKVIPSIIQNYRSIKDWLNRMKLRSSVKKTMGDKYSQNFIALLKQYHLIPKDTDN